MDKSSLYRYSKSPLLESSNFKTIDKKNIILKDFGKVKIIKIPAGFDLRDLKIQVNVLTQCVTRLDNHFGERKKCKMLDFLVYFDRKYVTIWRCPISP